MFGPKGVSSSRKRITISQCGEKAQSEEVLEAESLNGISFSIIYYAFQFGFAYVFIVVYFPRGLFYMVYLMSGMRIKRLHWYLTVKSITFFAFAILAVVRQNKYGKITIRSIYQIYKVMTLLMTFVFSTMLTKTFGTGLAYMMILFMAPMIVALCVDLYLCIVVNYYLEERIWQAQPKVQHKRKHDDENEEPVSTELLDKDGGRD